MIFGSQQCMLRDILAVWRKKQKINYAAISLYKRVCHLLAFLSFLKKMLPKWQKILIVMAVFGINSTYNSVLDVPSVEM